jgi:hypothetical protein
VFNGVGCFVGEESAGGVVVIVVLVVLVEGAGTGGLVDSSGHREAFCGTFMLTQLGGGRSCIDGGALFLLAAAPPPPPPRTSTRLLLLFLDGVSIRGGMLLLRFSANRNSAGTMLPAAGAQAGTVTKCFMWERRLFCSSFGWGIAFREGVFSRSPTSKAVCWCGDGETKSSIIETRT